MMFWHKKRVPNSLHGPARPLEILVQQWRQPSCYPVAPATSAEVHRVFAMTGMPATHDVLDLYGAIGGMENSDANIWRLWPLTEVETSAADANEYGVLFSDYFINCWCYRLKPNDASTSAIYVDHFDGKPLHKVADSLDDFFRLYLHDPLQLLDTPSS